MKLEGQVRLAIRDALNRSSRKPFAWGGLTGYQQLQAMAQALSRLPEEAAETGYLQQLKRRVERAVQRQQRLAQDLAEAHTWLKRIAACLRYPPSHFDPTPISGAQVQQDMQRLLVTVGGAIADPAAASERCVRLSTHTAPEYPGHCHWHTPNPYGRGPLGK